MEIEGLEFINKQYTCEFNVSGVHGRINKLSTGQYTVGYSGFDLREIVKYCTVQDAVRAELQRQLNNRMSNLVKIRKEIEAIEEVLSKEW